MVISRVYMVRGCPSSCHIDERFLFFSFDALVQYRLTMYTKKKKVESTRVNQPLYVGYL